jgi:hypothetical protein
MSPEYLEVKKQLRKDLDSWMKDMNDKGIESEKEALVRYPAKQ